MKVKSSLVLTKALALVESGQQFFACTAIQDVETDMRYNNNGKDVKSNAAAIFAKFRPASIPDNMKASQPWWAKGSQERTEAMKAAIEEAKAKGD